MPHVVHHAIDVTATPAQVWAAFCDLSTWARWFPYAVGAHAEGGATNEDPWRPGGVIVVELQVPVRGRVPLRLEVRDVAAARCVCWRGGAYGVRGEHTYRFDDHERWTRVTSHEEFSAGLLGSVALRAVRSRVDDMTHESLAKLRDVVEQRLAQGR